MGIYSPDSILWFGVVLGLFARLILRIFSDAASIILTDAAARLVEHRAHKRAMNALRQEAEGRS